MIYFKSHSHIKKQVIAHKCQHLLRTHKYALFFHYNGCALGKGVAFPLGRKAKKAPTLQSTESVANWQQLKEKISSVKNAEFCSLISLLLPSRWRISFTLPVPSAQAQAEHLTAPSGTGKQGVGFSVKKHTEIIDLKNLRTREEQNGDTEKRNPFPHANAFGAPFPIPHANAFGTGTGTPQGMAQAQRKGTGTTDFFPLFQGSTLLVAGSSLEQMGVVLENCASPTFIPIGGAYHMNFCSHLDIKRWVELDKDNVQVHTALCNQFTHWQRMLVALPNHLGHVPCVPGATLNSICGIRLLSLLYALEKKYLEHLLFIPPLLAQVAGQANEKTK